MGRKLLLRNHRGHESAEKLKHFVPENILENRTQRRPWFRYEEYSFPKIAQSAAKIMREGGIVAIGSHGQLQGLGYHWKCGLSIPAASHLSKPSGRPR